MSFSPTALAWGLPTPLAPNNVEADFFPGYMPLEGPCSSETSLQGVSTEVFPEKSLTTRRMGVYQAQRPETASPRHAAYHNIVQPYICGATHAPHTCRGACEDLITGIRLTLCLWLWRDVRPLVLAVRALAQSLVGVMAPLVQGAVWDTHAGREVESHRHADRRAPRAAVVPP